MCCDQVIVLSQFLCTLVTSKSFIFPGQEGVFDTVKCLRVSLVGLLVFGWFTALISDCLMCHTVVNLVWMFVFIMLTSYTDDICWLVGWLVGCSLFRTNVKTHFLQQFLHDETYPPQRLCIYSFYTDIRYWTNSLLCLCYYVSVKIKGPGLTSR